MTPAVSDAKHDRLLGLELPDERSGLRPALSARRSRPRRRVAAVPGRAAALGVAPASGGDQQDAREREPAARRLGRSANYGSPATTPDRQRSTGGSVVLRTALRGANADPSPRRAPACTRRGPVRSRARCGLTRRSMSVAATEDWDIAARARTDPDRPAMIFGDAVRRYGELEARLNRIARALRRAGIGRDDRVAVALHNGVRMVRDAERARSRGRASRAAELSRQGSRARLHDRRTPRRVCSSPTRASHPRSIAPSRSCSSGWDERLWVTGDAKPWRGRSFEEAIAGESAEPLETRSRAAGTTC